MNALSKWSRSDSIATVALLAAIWVLYAQHRDTYKLQLYVDRDQAQTKIVEAVEEIINERQLSMIKVEYNVYSPDAMTGMSLEQTNSDAKIAEPVVTALGKYKTTIQNNIRYFSDPSTTSALQTLELAG